MASSNPTRKARVRKQAWSPKEKQILTELWLAGTGIDKIALVLGRSRRSVETKASRLGLSRKGDSACSKAAVRGCLSCGSLFFSTGVCNRICLQCKTRKDWG